MAAVDNSRRLGLAGTVGTCLQCTPKCCCAVWCGTCVIDHDLHKSKDVWFSLDSLSCQLSKFGVGYALCCSGAAQGMMLEAYNEPRKEDSPVTQCTKACCASCVYTHHRDVMREVPYGGLSSRASGQTVIQQPVAVATQPGPSAPSSDSSKLMY